MDQSYAGKSAPLYDVALPTHSFQLLLIENDQASYLVRSSSIYGRTP